MEAAQNPDAIDYLVHEDFVITSGGQDIVGREAFKAWVKDFQARVHNFEFHVVETFQNQDGSRVASRWRVIGRNNGLTGTEPNGAPFEMCGTAVWEVGTDGLLRHNWVERNASEVYGAITRGRSAQRLLTVRPVNSPDLASSASSLRRVRLTVSRTSNVDHDSSTSSATATMTTTSAMKVRLTDVPISHIGPPLLQPCSVSGGSPSLSAICWQTLAISVRTSNTTCSMLRRIARSPRGAQRAGKLDNAVRVTPAMPSISASTSARHSAVPQKAEARL